MDKREFLYGCFFHDAGKLLAQPGEPHTPKTKEALELISITPEYQTILRVFGFDDYSHNEHVVHAIEKHHDATDELSAYIAIADQIASSESDDNLKNRLKKFPISTLITYLNEMHNFSDLHFYYIRFYSFSKNELNAVGRLLLLKLLFETIEQIPDVQLLYEVFNGCRIVTKLDSDSLKKLLVKRFEANLIKFIEKQNLENILGGAPDNYSQFTNLPKQIKPKLAELTVRKYAQDILDSLKKKRIQSLEDVGLSLDILLNLARLDEIFTLAKNGIRGISATKYYLFSDENGLFPKWVIESFFPREKQNKLLEKIVDNGVPRIELLLIKAGADITKITCKDQVYNKLFPLIVALGSLNGSTVDFHFDVGNYLAIDDEVPLSKIAQEAPCANCGVFEGEVELTPFAFEYKQHAKETLFKETEKDFRQRVKVICGLCQIEAIFNTLLCGTKLEGMQARIDTKTHLIFCGLGIDENLFEKLAPEEPIKKLIERFKITYQSIYIKKRDDLQFLVMSLEDIQAGSGNLVFQQFLFSLIATKLKNRCLVLALGVNKVPTTFNDSIVQFIDGEIPIIEDVRIDFFEYVFGSDLSFREKRDIVLQYFKKPFIGIAQIFKKSKLKYTHQTDELIRKMSKNDDLFDIANQIWEMAKLGGALETRKNVGSFLMGFNGTPQSLDLIANKLLKNTMLSSEKRGDILKIYEKLRDTLAKIDEKKRAQLKEYVQKTKYLFNSKKFYELKTEGVIEKDGSIQ
ncbi:MAG: hypothetical protein QXZ70_04455 [Candidatus Bathyarchaeia archaeon]